MHQKSYDQHLDCPQSFKYPFANKEVRWTVKKAHINDACRMPLS
jgi:hypothetical protein